LFSLAVLLLVFLYCFGRLTRTHQLPVVLSAAVFSFLEVSLIPVFLVGVAAFSSPQAPDRLKVFLLLAFLAGTYAGDFGFFAGFAGGFWLDRRKQRIRSTRRLLLESAAVGALLGALFPLYYLATNTTRVNAAFATSAGLLCALVGASCAALFAAAFRHRLTAAAAK
jgi:hypothetical protein